MALSVVDTASLIGIDAIQDPLVQVPYTPPTLIKATNVAADWVTQSGAVIALENFPQPSESGAAQGVSISMIDTDNFCWARCTAGILAGFKLSDAYLIELKFQTDAVQGGVNINFSPDSANHATKNLQFGWSMPGQVAQGMNDVTVRPAGDGSLEPGGAVWVNTGAVNLTDLVQSIGVQLVSNGSGTRKIIMDGIWKHTAPPTKGAVIFGTDGFGVAANLKFQQIMMEYGLNTYLAGDVDLAETYPDIIRQIQIYYANGGDVMFQGVGHVDYTQPGNLANLPTHVARGQAMADKIGLIRSRNLFAYPQSANNPSTDAVLLAAGIQKARTGYAWAIHPGADRAGPKLIGHGATNIGALTANQIVNIVNRAIAYGTTEEMYFHGELSESVIRAVAAYVAAAKARNVVDCDIPSRWLRKRNYGRATAA
jgi:hypothetical protein